MKILLTGKNGQVGWELQRALAPLGKIWAYDRQELDLQDAANLCKCVQEIKPDLIVNAAAYTAVDKAEEEQEAAFAINATAPEILAEEAKKCGALLVHYSTDYVFDGTAHRPYAETALTGPLNIYGKSKLKGEQAVEAVGGKHLILRTSWVYGTRGKNFFLTMLRLGKEKELLKIVDDQIGAPTWSRSIADMTAQMIHRTMQPNFSENWGIYHLTCAGQTSWHGFADAIFKNNELQKPITLQKIESSEYPLPAARPLYSVLSNRKLSDVFGLRMPEWQESLHLCMENK